MFVIRKRYARKLIHDEYGGQRRGGISTPKSHPFVFLFSYESGIQHGYSDGFLNDGSYMYSGEGQKGDIDRLRAHSPEQIDRSV